MFQKLKFKKTKNLKNLGTVFLATIYTVTVSAISIYVYQKLHSAGLCGEYALCIMEIPIYYFIPIIASSGFLIGAIMFFLLSEKEKEVEVCKSEEAERVEDVLSKVLPKKEKAILDILKDSSWTNQSEVSRKLNLTRVETFRLIKKLEEKNLIKREKTKRVVKLKRII